jgi:hypothetical protein
VVDIPQGTSIHISVFKDGGFHFTMSKEDNVQATPIIHFPLERVFIVEDEANGQKST